MTETEAPEFIPGEYIVQFDRIGRSRNVAALTAKAQNGPELATVIYKYARRFCGSSGIDVDVCFDGTGFISAGYRPAGDFRWSLSAAQKPTKGAPE